MCRALCDGILTLCASVGNKRFQLCSRISHMNALFRIYGINIQIRVKVEYKVMYALRKLVAHSPNYFYSGIRNIYSLCFIELHFTVKYLKILSATQQYFYRKFVSPATIKLT